MSCLRKKSKVRKDKGKMEQEIFLKGMFCGAIAEAIAILLAKGLNWIHKCNEEKRAMARKIDSIKWELEVLKIKRFSEGERSKENCNDE